VQLAEARLHELLALEGRLVFAVLAQVAELHGLPDLVRQDDVELVLEVLDLAAELALEFFEHGATAGPQGRPEGGRPRRGTTKGGARPRWAGRRDGPGR
jgi:hypothetical protein